MRETGSRGGFPVVVPFVDHLGARLLSCAEGASHVELDLAPHHCNSFGVAHGGVLMTLLDVAMAHAARSLHAGEPDHGPGVVTIEMKTSFMRPGEGRLSAQARLLHRSATLAFCEGSVFGADGHLCAHATATFKYLRKLPTQGRGAKPLRQRNPDATEKKP